MTVDVSVTVEPLVLLLQVKVYEVVEVGLAFTVPETLLTLPIPLSIEQESAFWQIHERVTA